MKNTLLAETLKKISKLGRKGFYEEFGRGSTFPQVVLDGEKLGGCTETVKYLKENQLLGSR